MEKYRRLIRFPYLKVCLVLVTLCFALTILDIIIVETFYRPICITSEDWQIIWKWHMLYGALIAMVPLFVAIKLRSLIPLGTWLFFIFGLEDTLFYVLQGYLPLQYPGISILGIWEPLLVQVLPINLVGFSLILVFTLNIGNVSQFIKRLIAK